MAFMIDDQLCVCAQATHVTPGNLRAFVQAKLRRLSDGVMVEKRLRKGEALRAEVGPPEVFPPGSVWGKRVLLGWGSTYGAIREAAEILGEGYAHVHLRELWPLRTEEIEGIWSEADEVILVEGTATGQLGVLIAGETGLRPHRFVPGYDGRPFTVHAIVEGVRG